MTIEKFRELKNKLSHIDLLESHIEKMKDKDIHIYYEGKTCDRFGSHFVVKESKLHRVIIEQMENELAQLKKDFEEA